MAASTSNSLSKPKQLSKRLVKQSAEGLKKTSLKTRKLGDSTSGHCENVIGRKRSTKKKPLYGNWRGLFAGTRDF